MSAKADSLLVVDDNELNRDALARLLQRQGYSVAVAQNGQQALEALGEQSVDLVLLDVTMPGLSGLEVLKVIRRMDSALALPVIMVTAKSQSADVVEALELGANDYVTKPLDFPVVLARIRTQLSLKRAVDQVTRLEQSLTQRNKELEAASAQLAAADQGMKRDLEAAAWVRQTFLPSEPPDVPGVRFAWALKPCSRLAGDLLNVLPLDARRLGIYVFDCGGHGVAASLLSVTVSRSLERLLAARWPAGPRGVAPSAGGTAPAEVVGELGRQFSKGPVTEQPFTLLYGMLDLETREFRFVSAGRPGPLYLPADGDAAVLGTSSLPVGLSGGNCKEHRVSLRPGDRLYLYSDGVTEARNPEGEHFGTRRLIHTVEQGRTAPLPDSLEVLSRSIEAWGGSPALQDDLTLLAFEVPPEDGQGPEGAE